MDHSVNRVAQKRAIPVIIGVILTVAIAASKMDSTREIVAKSSRVAVIVNNDPSERHQANVEAAIDALRPFHFEEIIAFGRENAVPTLAEIVSQLEAIQKERKILEVFYLTGHGGIMINKTNSSGIPAVMLKDRPLHADHLITLLGKGPCLIYLDQCFAPTFIENLEGQMRGDFLILSDKDGSHSQTSCRGISVHFWRRVKEMASERNLFAAAEQAWKETSVHGTSRRIGQPMSETKNIVENTPMQLASGRR
ncbi:MAG: hypothetical protein C4527_04360 [Candidatus Omnitrophota bacterium]|jgi:hypothetical protein|nr:MAG: hypothetical protein C4527_04360 [Candidatus Omnitrophota bacterium]